MKKQTAAVYSDPRMQELRRELWDTVRELRYAYARFDFVTDPGLIEAGIYDINALKSRYDVLLRKMKALQGRSLQPQDQNTPALTGETACMPAASMNGGRSCPS